MRIRLWSRNRKGVLVVTLTLVTVRKQRKRRYPIERNSAFLQQPLTAPSGGTGYVTGGHPTWPTFLDSVRIRAIGGADSILIKSTRSQGVSIGLNGSVTYTFPPKTYANRVGAIVTANNWSLILRTLDSRSSPPRLPSATEEPGAQELFSMSVQAVDTRSSCASGGHKLVRPVVPGDTNFVAKPLNPAVFPLCAQASNGGVGNVFSDVQTFFIPDTLRNACAANGDVRLTYNCL